MVFGTLLWFSGNRKSILVMYGPALLVSVGASWERQRGRVVMNGGVRPFSRHNLVSPPSGPATKLLPKGKINNVHSILLRLIMTLSLNLSHEMKGNKQKKFPFAETYYILSGL